MESGFVQAFITLWVVVDPLGTLPVLMTVSEGLAPGQQRRIALEAVAVAGGVLALFALLGGPLLSALDISINSFRIAGGMVLFLFALTLVFGEAKHRRDLASHGPVDRIAVFPVAIPSMASPGAMLVVTLLAQDPQHYGALVTLALLAGVMATAALILLLARPLHGAIGDTGASVVSRIMGMILASVAVDEVLEAFVNIGVIEAF